MASDQHSDMFWYSVDVLLDVTPMLYVGPIGFKEYKISRPLATLRGQYFNGNSEDSAMD